MDTILDRLGAIIKKLKSQAPITLHERAMMLETIERLKYWYEGQRIMSMAFYINGEWNNTISIENVSTILASLLSQDNKYSHIKLYYRNGSSRILQWSKEEHRFLRPEEITGLKE